MEYAAHSSSTGCRRGNLNAHLAYTMTCGGEPTDKLVFIVPISTSRIPTHRSWMKSMDSLCGTRRNNPVTWNKYGCCKKAKPNKAVPTVRSHIEFFWCSPNLRRPNGHGLFSTAPYPKYAQEPAWMYPNRGRITKD